MSLYARITLLLMAFVLAGTLVSSWFTWNTRVEDNLRANEEAARTLTAAIAKSVFADTLEGRFSRVRNTLRSIAKGNDDISYIMLIGFNGEVFASTWPDQPPQELSHALHAPSAEGAHASVMLDGKEVDDFSYPLLDGLDAHLHVGYNNARLERSLDRVLDNTLWFMLGVMLLALAAANFAARRVSRPLSQLADAVEEYGNGEPFVPPDVGSDGADVGVLIESFTHMVEKRKQAEQYLRIAATAFDAQEAILITDEKSNIIRVNRAFTHITGYEPGEVLGKRPSLFKSGRHDCEFYRQMWDILLREGHWSGEIWDRRRDGSAFPKWLTITAVHDADGKVTNYIGNFIDITERKEAESRMLELAYHDPLTMLANRYSMQERLGQMIALARREQTRFALMLIDLDKFKQINDTLGHPVGDRLLIEVAGRLTEMVRESDIVARLGGDEFVVVFNAADSLDAATTLAEKIVKSLSAPYLIDGAGLRTSPSIGICFFPDDADDMDTLLRKADAAMYRAKAKGCGRYQFFEVETA
ncbi:MAG: diguanylate cyclase [Gammaproteobacteria bacterium]|nr:diguanylate cyclase [Gammaproteobacteria bacterium]MBU1777590.1 diguanylate cyclase [Gammaproteobacteria bacterium]MBU1967684.1 diguanylate cyclase [Gammaproteobacteria bacterium]